ncbi:hypothetical protein F4818DRAFT_429333 [Hypoxylon cercidicola]|nr:hypothetical protein F4818DRAFT_429333 [Hypoxylon cercidicola]
MESLIEQASNHIDTIGPLIKAGHYDLICPDGNVILPSVWEQCIEPGWFITMQLWKDADDAKKQAEEVFKKKALDEAKLKAEEALKKSMGKDKAPIRFKDAVGRKFSFPFHMCQTWMSMQELIKQAFSHVDVIGPHVRAGHYDLMGPNGEIILPQVWEKVIEPNLAVTMTMWPMDRYPIPQGPVPRPPSPGMRYPGAPTPVPLPPSPPIHTVHVEKLSESPKPAKKRASKTTGGVLRWLGGGRRPRVNRRITRRTNTLFSKPKSATNSSSGSTAPSDDPPTHSSRNESESSNSVDEELSARQEAQQKELIVICKPSSLPNIHHQAIRRQTVLFLEKPRVPSRRLEISTARVYSENPLMFQSSLELIRRSQPTPPTRSQLAPSERAQLT